MGTVVLTLIYLAMIAFIFWLIARYENHHMIRKKINETVLKLIIEKMGSNKDFIIDDAMDLYRSYNRIDYNEIVLSFKSVTNVKNFLTEEQIYKLLKFKYEKDVL